VGSALTKLRISFLILDLRALVDRGLSVLASGTVDEATKQERGLAQHFTPEAWAATGTRIQQQWLDIME